MGNKLINNDDPDYIYDFESNAVALKMDHNSEHQKGKINSKNLYSWILKRNWVYIKI